MDLHVLSSIKPHIPIDPTKTKRSANERDIVPTKTKTTQCLVTF